MEKLYVNTPLIESLAFDCGDDTRVWLKMEALQPCGSFKARGMGYACAHYVKEGAQTLVSASGGNAGLAVAYSGRCLGVAVTVVVPETTKKRSIDLIEQEGAKVIVFGRNWDEAHTQALELAEKQSGVYLHPFDDPIVWKGHASIVDEISEAGIKPDVVVLSVGGGGLLCGVVEGLMRNSWEDVSVLAVETKGAESLHVASVAQRYIGIESINSIATSLGAKKVARRVYELLGQHTIESCVVSDKDAVSACYRFLNDHRLLVEPACGASLATVYDGCDFLKNKRNIVVVVCGGVGVTLPQLEEWSLLVS